MSERMVILKSMVNGTVSVNYPQYNINRRWSQTGQPVAIPFHTVEQCLWENGFRRMIDSGILYIESMQDKIDLGLEPADATEPVNIIALTQNQIDSLLKTASLDEFKETLLKLPRAQVDNLVEYAVEKEIVVMDKAAFVKELTGKDILASVSKKQQMREIEKREAQREKEHERDRENGRR